MENVFQPTIKVDNIEQVATPANLNQLARDVEGIRHWVEAREASAAAAAHQVAQKAQAERDEDRGKFKAEVEQLRLRMAQLEDDLLKKQAEVAAVHSTNMALEEACKRSEAEEDRLKRELQVVMTRATNEAAARMLAAEDSSQD